MKLGFFGMPQEVSSYREAVDISVANGLQYIELYNGWEFDGRLSLPELLQNAGEWKAYADSKGIMVSCFSAHTDVVGPGREAAITKLKNLAEVCAVVGSPYLHHTLAPSLDPAAVTDTDMAFERAVSAVREICDYAAALGVKCLYEPQGMIFNGSRAMERLLNEVGREIALVADVGNPLFVDEPPEQFVARFADRIAHVHIKDYLVKERACGDPGRYWHQTKGGNYLRDTIAGHGHVKLYAVFCSLLKAGYAGAYSLECSGLEHCHPYAAALDIENVKRIYQEVQTLI